MIKPLLLLVCFLFIPLSLVSQVRITEKKVEEVLIKLENAEVDIVEVKTLKKWKAFELSHEMKPQMNYNVVKVKYNSKGEVRTVIFDMNLVPIRYDYLDRIEWPYIRSCICMHNCFEPEGWKHRIGKPLK